MKHEKKTDIKKYVNTIAKEYNWEKQTILANIRNAH